MRWRVRVSGAWGCLNAVAFLPLVLSDGTLPASPPSFGSSWSATVSANLTQVGYDAGLVIVNFKQQCDVDPAQMKQQTVYGDFYTVLTRCDLMREYTIAPKSRGGTCQERVIGVDTDLRICEACGCPFCVRDTNGSWTHGESSAAVTVWSDPFETTIQGDNVVVWRGIARPKSGGDDGDADDGLGDFGLQTDVAFSAPSTYGGSFQDAIPRFINVSHPLWIRTTAKIEHFRRNSVPDSAFDVPKGCHGGGGKAAEETGDDWKPVSIVIAACVGMISIVVLQAAKATAAKPSSSSSSSSTSPSFDERHFWKLAVWVVYASVTVGCWVVSSTWVGLHEGLYCYYYETDGASTSSCNGFFKLPDWSSTNGGSRGWFPRTKADALAANSDDRSIVLYLLLWLLLLASVAQEASPALKRSLRAPSPRPVCVLLQQLGCLLSCNPLKSFAALLAGSVGALCRWGRNRRRRRRKRQQRRPQQQQQQQQGLNDYDTLPTPATASPPTQPPPPRPSASGCCRDRGVPFEPSVGEVLAGTAVFGAVAVFVASFAAQELTSCYGGDGSDDGDDVFTTDDDGGSSSSGDDDEFLFGYDLSAEPGPDRRAHCALKAAAVTCGKADNLLLALALLPVGRHSLWTALLDVDWRRCVKWHAAVGRAAAAGVALHVGLYQLYWALKGDWARQALRYAAAHPRSRRNPTPWVVPLMEVLFVAMLVVWAASLDCVRHGSGGADPSFDSDSDSDSGSDSGTESGSDSDGQKDGDLERNDGNGGSRGQSVGGEQESRRRRRRRRKRSSRRRRRITREGGKEPQEGKGAAGGEKKPCPLGLGCCGTAGAYEAFYYTHLFSLVFLVASLLHSWDAWHFLLVPSLLYAADRALRTFQARAASQAVVVVGARLLPGEVLRLDLASSPSSRRQSSGGRGGRDLGRLRPGQFIFLNVPAVSTLEYHPFTAVASAVLPPLHSHHNDDDDNDNGKDDNSGSDGATISVFLKSMGEGSWTGTLCDLVESGTDGPQKQQQQQQQQLWREEYDSLEALKSPLVVVANSPNRTTSSSGDDRLGKVPSVSPPKFAVSIEGPYGKDDLLDSLLSTPHSSPCSPSASSDADDASVVLFIAGGIGFTPVATLLPALMEHWATQPTARARAVVVVWAVRSWEVAERWGFRQLLVDAIARGDGSGGGSGGGSGISVRVQIHVTGGRTGHDGRGGSGGPMEISLTAGASSDIGSIEDDVVLNNNDDDDDDDDTENALLPAQQQQQQQPEQPQQSEQQSHQPQQPQQPQCFPSLYSSSERPIQFEALAAARDPFEIAAGRPVLDPDVLLTDKELAAAASGSLSVFCCGPQAMLRSAEQRCASRPRTKYHTEQFQL